MSVMFLPGPSDIREPSEALVRRDGNQYGAEDSRNAGHCKESQGKCLLTVIMYFTMPTG